MSVFRNVVKYATERSGRRRILQHTPTAPPRYKSTNRLPAAVYSQLQTVSQFPGGKQEEPNHKIIEVSPCYKMDSMFFCSSVRLYFPHGTNSIYIIYFSDIAMEY